MRNIYVELHNPTTHGLHFLTRKREKSSDPLDAAAESLTREQWKETAYNALTVSVSVAVAYAVTFWV